MKSKNLRASLFLAFFLLIFLSNLPPGKWILDLAIDEYHYRYSNNNGTLTYVEYKSHDTKGLLRGLNSYKKSFPESKDTIIYRLFKKDILCFGDSIKEAALANELGFIKPYDPNAPQSTFGNQHEQMAQNFINEMANILKEYKIITESDLTDLRTVFQDLTIDTYYKALAWGGLTGDINGYLTKAWETFATANSTLAQKYKVVITAEQNGTPLPATKEKCP